MKPEQAFAVLVERVAAYHPLPARFDEEELAQWPRAAVSALKAAKLLAKAPGATSAVCPGCEQACTMPVHTSAREGYDPSPFVVCDKRSDINRVAIPPARLRLWKCDAEALCNWAAGSLEVRRVRAAAAEPGLAAIGSFHGKKQSQLLLLALGEEPAVRTATGNTTPLVHLVRFHETRFKLDRPRIEALVDASPPGDARYVPSILRRELGKQETRDRHQRWRQAYRTLQLEHPDWTDSRIANKIAGTDDADGCAAETIRKNMK